MFVTVNCQGRRQFLAALSKFEVDISLMAFHAFKRCFGFWILMSTIPLYKSSFFFFLEVNQILKSEKKTHCRRVQTIRVKILVVVIQCA